MLKTCICNQIDDLKWGREQRKKVLVQERFEQSMNRIEDVRPV
jgi:hypothetical protein